MFSFNLVSWLRSLTRRRARPIEKRPRFRLTLEELENRVAPAVFTWTGNDTLANGATANKWSANANWAGNVAPTAGAPVQLNFQNLGTAFFTAENDIPDLVVDQLTIATDSSTDPTHTFTLTGTQVLTLANPTTNTASLLVNSGSLNTVITMGIQLGNAVGSTESIIVQSSASLTISGQLFGNSATQLSKDGVGPLTLAGDNSGFRGPFSINKSIGNGAVIITHVDALGANRTSELQRLTISGATAGVTQVTLTYPDGLGNPSTTFTFQGTLADETEIESRLNTLFDNLGLGYTGNPVNVTRTASGVGSATFSIDFTGTMAGIGVLQLTATTTGGGSAAASTLAQGGALNYTTINTNTELQVNVPSTAGVPNPIVDNPIKVFGAGVDNFSGAIVRNVADAVGRSATLAGNIEMQSNVTIGGITNANLIITGTISNTSPFELTKEGVSNLFLNPTDIPSASNFFNGGNTYQGDTNINQGNVQVGHPFALGRGGATAYVNSNTNETGSIQVRFTGNTNTRPEYLYYERVQTVTLTDAIEGTTAFVLGFNGDFTTPITYTSSIAGLVASRMNTLSTIAGIGASVSVTQTGNTLFITFKDSLGGFDIPTLNATITSAFGTGSITVGITPGATAVGFQIPNQYLVVAGTSSTLSIASGTSPIVITATGHRLTTGQTVRVTNVAGNPAANGTWIITVLDSNRFSLNGSAGTSTGIGGNWSLVPLSNVAGHNSWEQPTANTATLAIDLSNATYPIAVDQFLNFTVNGKIGNGTIIKSALGRLILPHVNPLTGPVLIDEGALNIRDSLALNGFNPTVSPLVAAGASLELQADQFPDSSGMAGVYNLYFPANTTFNLRGTGLYGSGALHNMSGTNIIEGSVILGGPTYISVDPDPDPYNLQGLTANNLSQLTINGVVSGSALTKVGYGELVLTNKNTFANGTGQNVYQLFIDKGWVTAQNSRALGAVYNTLNPVLQPGVQVDAGAAVMLKYDLEGNNLNLPYAFNLSGTGINHRFPWLHQTGALVNLDGNNLITGEIYLTGEAAIGVQIDSAIQPFANVSQLLLTGAIHDGAGAAGKLVKLGTQRLILQGEGLYTGGVDINEGVLTVQHETALGLGTSSPISLVTGNGLPIDITSLNHGLATGQEVTITGVGGNTAANGTFTITKLDNDRFRLNGVTGNSGYTSGGNWIFNTKTVVESGAALEFGSSIPLVNGGIQRGLQTWYNHLVLNGPGNSLFGAAPLMSETGDNLWRGPITLNANIAVAFQGPAAATTLPTMLTTVNAADPSATLTATTSTPGTPGIGSAPGINAVQTLTFGGTFATGDTFTLVVGSANAVTKTTASFSQPLVGSSVAVAVVSTASLSVGQTVYVANGGYYTVASIFSANSVTLTNLGSPGNAGPGATIVVGSNVGLGTTLQTAPIAWNSNLNTLIANIQAALDTPAMQALFTGGSFASVASVSPLIDILPNSRLTVTGSIGDGADVGANPADITIAGGGELNLAGSNDYRGTTYLNQGILTIQNPQALGQGPQDQVQVLRLAGANPGVTEFTLSFNGYTTPTITYTHTAADANVMEAALNALPSIGSVGGTADVAAIDLSDPAQPVYRITLGSALSGFSQPFVTVPTITTGTASSVISITGAGGTIVEERTQLQLQGGISVTGEPVTLQGTGNPLQSEVQRVHVTGPIYGSFQLTFTNPNTSPTPTTSTTASIPIGAPAALVQNALNALPAIQAGDGLGGGSVAVSMSGLNVYTVVFQGTFTGASQPWSQQAVTVTGTSGAFDLNFTGYAATATVTVGATPAATRTSLQAALDTLLTNLSSPGDASGTALVTVTPTGFLITFAGTLADVAVPLLQASAFTGSPLPGASIVSQPWLFASSAAQTMSVSGTSGTFNLNFAGFAPTATVTVGATAADTLPSLQTALNTLLGNASSPGAGAGTANVDVAVTGNFLITFGGSLTNQAVPVLLAGTFTGAAGAAVVANGSTANVTELIQGGTTNATPTQWFSSGPSPVANGAVNFTASTRKGDLAGPVTSITTDPNDANIIYISTAAGGSWKTYNGGITWTPLFDGLSNVQSFDIFGVNASTDTYSATFTDPFSGAVYTTTQLPYNATAEELRAALNKIVGAGNTVTVGQKIQTIQGVDEVQQLTINDITGRGENNWQPNITRFQLSYQGATTGNILYTGISTTDAASIQTALNNLSTIGIGNSLVSDLTAVGANETFQIRFIGTLGQQPAGLITFNIGGADQYWLPGPVPNGPGFGTRFPRINNIPSRVYPGPASGPSGPGPHNWDTGSLTQITAGRRPGLGTGVSSVQQITLNTSTSTWTTTAADPLHYTRFRLSFKGVTTAPIAYTGNVFQDAANIEAALNALGFFEPGGKVTVKVASTGPDESFFINFQGTLALSSQPAISFTLGGADDFWSPNPAPSPFPTINGVPANGTEDLGDLIVVVSGYGPTLTNTIAFSGGQLANVNVAPLDIDITGNALLGQSVSYGTLTSGSDYTAPTVAFTDANLNGGAAGSGAVGVVSGTVTAITNLTGGSGYTSAPTVTFVDPLGLGSGATGIAIMNGDEVLSITITSGGSGYTQAPNVVFTGGGATTAATAECTLSITAVTITNGGSGYSEPTDVAIKDVVGGAGAGATGIAVVSGGRIQRVIVTSGTGYSRSPSVNFSGGGVGAAGYATINGKVTGGSIAVGAPFTTASGVGVGVGYFANPIVEIVRGGTNAVGDGDEAVAAGSVAYATAQNNVYVRALTNIQGTIGSGTFSLPPPPNPSTRRDVGLSMTATAVANGSTVTITYGGEGYDWYNPPTGIILPGGGTADAILDSGVFGITLSKDYTGNAGGPLAVRFTGGGGTGAAGTAYGGVTAISTPTTTTDFDTNPTVVITPAGGDTPTRDAFAVAYVDDNGKIVSVVVHDAGEGYTRPPTITFTVPASGTGAASGSEATLSVMEVVITNPGSGYTSAPTITFPDDTGVGATGIATLNGDQVASVDVTSGSGYGSAPLMLIKPVNVFKDYPGSPSGNTNSYLYFTTQAQGAVATSYLSGSATGVVVTSPGNSYTSVPTSVGFGTTPPPPSTILPAIPNPPASAATATSTLQTTVLQSGINSQIAMTGGSIAIDPTNTATLYYATGQGNNSLDSFYGTGVYRSTDYGQTWNLLTDPTLPDLPSPGNPLVGLAINKILLDSTNKVLYVATSDRAANGFEGDDTDNTASASNPGVWRYNLVTDTWFNLTALSSAGRLTGPTTKPQPANAPGAPPLGPTPPEVAGPDDFFSISFPQNNASWTDIALSNGNLVASLGTSNGDLANAVYYLVNPTLQDDSNNPPKWYKSSPNFSPATDYPIYPLLDGNTINTFPPDRISNIRLSVSGSTIYAALTDTFLDIFKSIQQSVDGGVLWTTFTPPSNYQGNNGIYASAITGTGPIYVGGTDANGSSYVLRFSGGIWSPISVDSAGNGPHTDILTLTLDSAGNLLAGTDGGIWRYNVGSQLWTNLNGNLATVEFNAIASTPTNPNSVFGVGRGISVVEYTGTQSWTQSMGIPPSPVATSNSLSGSSLAINRNNPNIMYAFQQGTPWAPSARLFRSTNGGNTWSGVNFFGTPVTSGTLNAPVVIDALSRVFVGGGSLRVHNPPTIPESLTLYTGSVAGIAVAELQGAFNADPRFTAVTDLGATSPDPNTIYITSGTSISVTKNFGLSWQTAAAIPNFVVGAKPDPFNTITDIAVDPRNRDLIYAVIGGTPGLPLTGTVWQSTDAGQTWTNISTGLPSKMGQIGIRVVSGGAGYTSAPTVTIRGGGGFGATAVATINGSGAVTGVTLTNLGSGYTSAPTIVFTGGGGSGATAQGSLGLASITVTNGGSGYIEPPTVTIVGGGGSGATAVARILQGVVVGVTLTNGGSGYTDTPFVTFSPPPSGVQADAIALFGGLPAWDIVVDPRTDLLYLGTDNGVYQYTTGNTRSWAPFGDNLPQVAVHALDLNQSTNILTAGTYGRSAYQFYIDTPTVNSGALYAASGSDIWNGPIILAGPTTISASGEQTLQNGVSLTQLTILGRISDQTYAAMASGANTLTKIGGGNVTLVGSSIYTGTTLVNQGNLIIQNPNALGGAAIPGSQELFLAGAVADDTVFKLTFPDNNTNPTTAAIPFTGTAADAVTIANELNALFNGVGYAGTPVTVTENGPGIFLVTFGGSMTGVTLPTLIGTVTSGLGEAFFTATGGTAVARGSILQLTTSLDTEPLFLFGDGVQNNGHWSGALENVTGTNTYTGTITLMTDATIGVDGTSSLLITSPNPDVIPGITDLGGGPSGQFKLTKETSGRLALASTNTYQGGTDVNQGVLNIQHSGALGLGGTTTTVLDPAQLQLEQGVSGPVNVNDQNLVLSGVGPSSGGAFLNVNGDNSWGSPANTVMLTSVPRFSPQSMPVGVVSFAVANADDTLKIDSPIIEAPAMMQGVLAAPPGSPTFNSATSVATGGSWASTGTYRWVITAIGPNGESIPSNERSATVSPTTDRVNLAWTSLGAGFTYNVYRATVAGVYTAFSRVNAAPIAGTTFTDTGTATLAGAPPMTMASGVVKIGDGTLIFAQDNAYRGTTYVQNGILDIQKSKSLGLNNGNAVQRVTIADPLLTNEFRLSFKGQSTPAFGSAGALDFRSTAAEVATALNALSTIGAGGVTVTLNEVYSGISEVHDVVFTNAVAGATTYRLSFGGSQTPVLTYTGVAATDIAAIENALNALATIGGLAPFANTPYAGKVNVTANRTGDVFNITYGGALQAQTLANLLAVTVTSGPGTGTATTHLVQRGFGVPTDVYTITFSGAAFDPDVPIPALGITTSSAGVLSSISTVADGGIGTIVSTDAALYLDGDPTHSGASLTTPNVETLVLNGDGVGTAGSLRNISGNNTWAGRITLQTSSTIGVEPTTRLDITGLVRDPSPAPLPPASVVPPNLTKEGDGILAFPNANTYTGNTYIEAGVVNIQNPNSLGINNSEQQTVSVSGAGTFTLNFTGFPTVTTGVLPSNVTAAGLAFAINNALLATTHPILGGGTGQVSVVATASGSTFVVTFGTGAFGDSLTGKDVPLLVAPSANWTGSASVTTAVLLAGASTGTFVADGATLQVQNTTEASLKPLTINGRGFDDMGALQNLAGNNAWRNLPITLGSNAAIGVAAATDTLTITQPITDNGSDYRVTKVGPGIVQYSAHSGVITNTTGNGVSPIVVTSNAHGLKTGQQVIISGVGGNTNANSTFTITVVHPNEFSLNGATGNGAYGGGGSWRLLASNTYTGLTVVEAGELQLNSAATAIQKDLQVGDNAPVSQVQTLTLSGFTTGTGQFILTFDDGVNPPLDTAAITYYTNPTYEADQIEAALNAILGANTVMVTAVNTTNFTVVFGGALAGSNPLALTGASATGSVSASITTAGAPPTPNSAIARWLGNNQMRTSSVVEVKSDGLLDLNARAEQIAKLTVNTGTATTNAAATGAGALTVVGSGGVTVNGGTLTTQGASSTVAITGPLDVLAGGTLSTPGMTSQVAVTGTTTVTDSTVSVSGASSQVILNGPTTVTNSNVTLSGPNSQLTATGATIVTASTVTLSGANTKATVNGTLTENDSTITASGDNALIDTNGLFTMNGGDVVLSGLGSLLDLGDNVTATSNAVTGSATISGQGLVSLGGVTRTFTITDGVAASDLVVSSVIDGTGTEGLTKTGAGRLELDADETYTGATTINAGDVQVDAGASLADVVLDASTSTPGSISGKGAVGMITRTGSTATLVTTLTGFSTGQQFTLTYRAGASSATTAPITRASTSAVTASDIQTQLTSLLGTLGVAGSVAVTGAAGDVYTITFTSAAAATLVPVVGTPVGAAVGTILTVPVNVVGPGYNGTTRIGILNTNGNVLWTPDTSFAVDLSNTSGQHPNPVVGSDYDQLVVNGTIDLGNAFLAGSVIVSDVQIGDVFTILEATGGIQPGSQLDGIIGATRGAIAQDGTVFVDGKKFSLHYFPNSIVLTRTRISSTVALTSSQNASVYGRDVIITAKVTPEPGATVPASGLGITFTVDRGTPFERVTAPIALNAMGEASFEPQELYGVWNIPAALSATHTIDADLVDSTGEFAPKSAPTFTQTVNQNTVNPVGVASTPTVSATAPVYGQQMKFTATVTPTLVPNVTGASKPTGTVTFTLDPSGGSPTSYTVALNTGAGTAVLDAPAFPALIPVGTHTIRVGYDGDPATPNYNYAPSASPTNFAFTVKKDTTTTSITAVPPTKPLGQMADFEVVVSPGLSGSTGVPQGTLTFFVDNPNIPANQIGTLNYTGGTVVFSTDDLTQGSHTIFVKFAATDGNYFNSDDSTPIDITPAETKTTIESATPSNPNYGDQVTFIVSVVDDPAIDAAFGDPTGTVTIWMDAIGVGAGGTNLGEVNLNAGSAGILTDPGALTQGTHTIYAVYSGDTAFATSFDTLSNFVVDQASTTTTVTANPAGGSIFGQSVTLTATVSWALGNPSVGNVNFTDDLGTDLGTASVGSNGKAVLATTALTVGTRTITAAYHDDTASANFADSFGTVNNYIVVAASTTTTVTANPGSSVFGQSVTFTATVTSPGGTPPIGNSSVEFVDTTTGTVLGYGTPGAGNTAVLTTNVLTVAVHTITATYTDTNDNNFSPSSGSRPGFVVSKASSSVAVSADWSTEPTTAVFGQDVTFIATVTSPTGTPPIGNSSVQFVDATTGTVLGFGTPGGGNTASITTNLLSAATHTITATYTGSSNFNGNTGSLSTFVIAAADTTITSFTSSAAFPGVGQTVTFTATASANNPSTAAVNGGSITFVDTTTGLTLGTAAVNASGTASVNASFTTTGIHDITAKYNGGNPRFNASAIANLAVTVRKASTVSVSPISPAVFGQTLNYAVTVAGTPGVPSGSVLVTDTSTGIDYGPFVLNALGKTTATLTGLNAGSHPLVFSYSGDTVGAGFAPSSKNITQVVSASSTTTTFTSTTSSAVYGSTVSYAGKVTAAGGVNPTSGTVVLKDATTNTTLASVALSAAGLFTFTNVPLPLNLNFGAHSMRASFTPSNGNHLASPASTAAALNITQAFTTVSTPTSSVTSSPLGGSFFGQAVKFTVNVSSTNSPATPAGGTVTFKRGTTVLGTVSLGAGGAASYTTTATQLPVNTAPGHSVTAVYNSSNPASPTTANFKASAASGAFLQKVSKATTSTTLASSTGGNSSYGQAVTFTATVAKTSDGSPGTPTGTVTFRDNGNLLATVSLVSGKASYKTSLLSAASHAITATYNPATPPGNFESSNDALTQDVALTNTTTTLTSSPTTWAIGKATTFTATVKSVVPGVVPTGAVTFTVDDSTGTIFSSTVNLVGGVAKLNSYLFPTNIDDYTVTATYDPATVPNQNFNGSTTAQTQRVRNATTAALTSTSSTSGVTLKMTISGVGGPPTGTVSFYEIINGVKQLLGQVNLNNGAASLFANLATGNHTILAVYSGDANFNGASIQKVVQGKVTGRLV